MTSLRSIKRFEVMPTLPPTLRALLAGIIERVTISSPGAAFSVSAMEAPEYR
jgi:hypothetical protein